MASAPRSQMLRFNSSPIRAEKAAERNDARAEDEGGHRKRDSEHEHHCLARQIPQHPRNRRSAAHSVSSAVSRDTKEAITVERAVARLFSDHQSSPRQACVSSYRSRSSIEPPCLLAMDAKYVRHRHLASREFLVIDGLVLLDSVEEPRQRVMCLDVPPRPGNVLTNTVRQVCPRRHGRF